MKIIGLGHKARHGKDTCAEIWKNFKPDETLVLHFADSLKEEVAYNEYLPLLTLVRTKPNHSVIIRIPNEDCSDPCKKYKFNILFSDDAVPFLKYMQKNNIQDMYYGMKEKDSELLQIWGTDFRRKLYGNDYWSNVVKNKIERLLKNPGRIKYVLIPDTRFKNELDMIKSFNGIYIKVTRNDYVDISRDPTHLSENDLNDVIPDYHITADSGDIESLKQQTLKIINDMK